MKQFEPDDYVSFTIVGRGWSFTLYSWEKMKTDWHNTPAGTLYGNKPTRNRDDFRIVKLEKGVFAVEQRNGAKWVTVAEKKTTAKAESFIIKQLNNGN